MTDYTPEATLESNHERAYQRIEAMIRNADPVIRDADHEEAVVRMLADLQQYCDRYSLRWMRVTDKALSLANQEDEADDRAGWNGPRSTYAPQLRGRVG
jgi:hypothetical protein